MNQTNCIFILVLLTGIACQSSKSNKVNYPTPTANVLPSDIDFQKEYALVSNEYGTETYVAIQEDSRHIKTNALPNHPTGKFPNKGNPNRISAQNSTYKIPLKPRFSGKSQWAREPGVAVNGIKFEPETAEKFVCETGEVYRIEAFQELVDLGLDFNHGHVQPTGAYHYHGVPTELVKLLDRGEDLILVALLWMALPYTIPKAGDTNPVTP